MDEFLSGAPFTGFLLAAGAACLLGISAPSLMPVWTAPPEVGLWSLPDAVGTDGIALARAAAAAYALAAGLWLVFLAIRIAVTPLKASVYVESGSVDPWYAPLDRLASALFSGFTLIAGGSLVVIGAAILLGGSIAAPVGWFAIVIGAVSVGGYLGFGDMPPFVAFLPSGLIGIVLLMTAR